MKTVEVPTGFDFAAVPDLDIDTIGQAEIESAFRLDMPAHHRGWTAVSCRRNCRDNPGCLTFLGEDNWWWAEEEELDEEEEVVTVVCPSVYTVLLEQATRMFCISLLG